MLTLALDTSGDICSVAVFDGTIERITVTFRHERRLSERLPGIVEFALADVGASLRSVEALAVGLGPGSFTGVRIGVTMAKTWAWTLAVPLVGVSSLDAVALRLPNLRDVGIAAVTPTRRTEVVAAFYTDPGSAPVAPPEVIPNADVVDIGAQRLPGAQMILVCGEAAAAVLQATVSLARARAIALPTSPSAADIARLAAPRLARGTTDDPDTLVPLYVTPSPVG